MYLLRMNDSEGRLSLSELESYLGFQLESHTVSDSQKPRVTILYGARWRMMCVV